MGDRGTVSRQSPRKVRQLADQAWTGGHICLNSKALAWGQRGHVRPGVTLPLLLDLARGWQAASWVTPTGICLPRITPCSPLPFRPGRPWDSLKPIKVSRSDALPVLAEA